MDNSPGVRRAHAGDRVGEDAKADRVVAAMFGRGSLFLAVWSMQLVASVASTPIVSRILGTSAFGRTATAITVLSALAPLVGLGLQSAVQRVYVEQDGHARARGLLATAMVLGLAMGVVLHLTGRWWSPAIGFGHYGTFEAVTVLWATLLGMTQVTLAFIRSEDRLGAFASISFVQSIGCQVFGITAVVLVAKSPTSFMTGAALAQGLALTAGVAYCRPRPLGLSNWATTSGALKYSLPLIPQVLSAYILNASDRLIVQRDLGPIAVARYQVAYNLSSLSIILLGAVNQVWAPRFFAVRDDAMRWQVLASLRDQIFRILLPLTIGLAVGAPAMIRYYVPPSYHASKLVTVIVPVALSGIPYGAYLASLRILLWNKHTAQVASVSAIAALLNIGLNLWLVPIMHIAGSALATLACYGVLAVGTFVVSRRYVKLPAPSVGAIMSVGAAAAATVATLALPSTSIWLVIRLLIGAACLVWFAKRIAGILALGRPIGAHSRRRATA